MVYTADEDFDDSRLRAYARKVAAARDDAPWSTKDTLIRTETRKLFRKVTTFSRGSEDLPGWILLMNREEGRLASIKGLGSRGEPRIEGFEHGRALLLGHEGTLFTAEYDITIGDRQGLGVFDLFEPLKFSEASKNNLLGFDRLNRHTYRSKRAESNEVWREELGVRFATRAKQPKPGLETSLALKNFLENRVYFSKLSNGYF